MSTAAAITTPASATTTATPPASTAAAIAAPATSPVTTTAAPNTSGTGAAPAAGNWVDSFADADLKGWATNKGYKGPEDLANAYRNLEKLHGVPQERLMKLPDAFYDEKGSLTPEGRAIYERLGAPKDAKDYGIEVPKEGGDPKRLENFLKNAMDLGLTKTQAQRLATADGEYIKGVVSGTAEMAAAKHRDESVALRAEWGAAYEQNKNIAADAVRKMGWDAKKIDAIAGAMGHADTMKMLCQMGKSFGEASYIGGKAGAGAMEPATAKARINELKADRDFGARLMNNDLEAKATWDRLHQQAYQGTVNL